MSRDRVVEYTFVRGINHITQPRRETYFNVIVYSTVLQTRTLLL